MELYVADIFGVLTPPLTGGPATASDRQRGRSTGIVLVCTVVKKAVRRSTIVRNQLLYCPIIDEQLGILPTDAQSPT